MEIRRPLPKALAQFRWYIKEARGQLLIPRRIVRELLGERTYEKLKKEYGHRFQPEGIPFWAVGDFLEV